MKKLILMALSLALVLAMTACGSSKDTTETTTATTAATTAPATDKTAPSASKPNASFDAAQAAPVIGVWQFQYTIPAETFNLEGFETPLNVQMLYTLSEDATWFITVDWDKTNANIEEFSKSLSAYTCELMYKQFADKNLDKEQANQAMQNQYGKTVEEYVDDLIGQTLSVEALSASTPEESGTYYVEGNSVHLSSPSSSAEEVISFTVEGDTLTLQSSNGPDQDLYPLVMTRSAN